jgi:transposase
MAGTAVVMVRVLVAAMTAGVAVAGIAGVVERHDVVAVRTLTRRRLPAEGRREYRRQQDGEQQGGNVSQDAAHRRIVSKRGHFGYLSIPDPKADLFVELLKKMMKYRKKPIHLVLDSLPAHKTALVKKYVTSTEGRLTLHFLPGYAPDLNPDELVWSHVKRTGTARRPLQKGEKLRDKIEEQLAALQKLPLLVRSFFNASSVAYIGDC